MSFPSVTALTAGSLLILQMLLGFLTSGARGASGQWIGHGDDVALLRAARRHGNLAENAGIFIAGFLLLELSKWNPQALMGLCAAFIVARLLHAIGLSQANTNNLFRLLGGVGTYLLGFALGGLLIFIGLHAETAAKALG